MRFLLTAWAVFLLISPNPGMAQTGPSLPSYYDYFFNREGRLLFYRPTTAANRYFLCRNTQRYNSIFSAEERLAQEGPHAVAGAFVLRITPKMLRRASRRLHGGPFDQSLVDSNFVPILPPSVLSLMRAHIRDDGNCYTPTIDFTEYGGYYHKATGQIDTAVTRGSQSPCAHARIDIDMSDSIYTYHSHPSGINTCGDTTGSFISAPSRKDQLASHYINYVFGMRKHIIYVCTAEGIAATVRFRIISRRALDKTPKALYVYFVAPPRFQW